METVFVSYSRADADFADRIGQSWTYVIQRFLLPTTNGYCALGILSIIERIAQSVVAADSVIALLSPTSVEFGLGQIRSPVRDDERNKKANS